MAMEAVHIYPDAKALSPDETLFRTMLAGADSFAIQGYALDGITVYWDRGSERLYGYTRSEALGRSLLNLIIPEEMKAEVRQDIASMCTTGIAIPSSPLRLRRKDGGARDVFSFHSITVNTRGIQELLCIDLDLSGVADRCPECVRMLNEMKGDANPRREIFLASSLIEKVAESESVDLDPDIALNLIVHELKVIFDADKCLITGWEDEGNGAGMAVVRVGSGKWRSTYRTLTAKEGETTLTASLMRAGKVIAIENAGDSPYISPRIAQKFGANSILGIPLILGDRKLGAALITWNAPHRFDEGELALAESLSAAVPKILGNPRGGMAGRNLSGSG